MPWASAHLERGVDHFLGRDRGERRHARRSASAVFSASSSRSAAGTTLRDQARALGLGGVHHPAGQAHFHRLGLADRARQPLRAAHARRDAELDLRLAELGGVGGDDEVGHHRHFAAAAQREAGDRGDPRLAGRGDLLPAGEEIGRIHVGEALGLHLLDVGAGGERLFASRSGPGSAATGRRRRRRRRRSARSSTWLLSALSACGRLRVTRVTASRCSTRMVS